MRAPAAGIGAGIAIGVWLACSSAPASAGRDELRRQARAAWWALKGWSCPNLVRSLAHYDPVARSLSREWLPAALCEREIRERFLCKLPEIVEGSPDLIDASARAAWKNRRDCLPASVAPGPMGLGAGMVCGLSHLARAPIRRAAACLGALRQDHGLSLVLRELDGAGCGVMARFTVDAILGILARGSSMPAALGRWVRRLERTLAAYDWHIIRRTLGASSVEEAVAAVERRALRLPACATAPGPGATVVAR